ncbi:cytochrome c maturation protein CcmE [Cytobacillus sp. FJAT-54145]|uniref:Cytochrome c maturation protein CcmE n=1 Tax=Cytobacillus spartinae TaxID=3299023 RepID=A0ABW6KGG3_9BACI
MSKNKKIIFGLSLVAAAIAIMFFSTMPSAGSKELTIDEVLSNKESYEEKYIMTQGLLDVSSIDWNPDDIVLKFEIYEEGTENLPIRYEGVKPDNFTQDVIVIVEGFITKEGVFEAEKVQTKCPSKYEGEDIENYDSEMHKELYKEKQNN